MAAPISRLYNFVNDSQNLVPISSTEVDAELDQLVATVNKIGVAQASAPLSPVEGDIWCDTTNYLIKLYDGSGWIAMQPIGKGADVASATTTTLGTDGNLFDITGTTNITSIAAMTAGLVVTLQFDGALTVTDGSNLKLNGDFISVAGSCLTLISDGTNWWEVSRTWIPSAVNALAGSVVQTVNVLVATSSTGTTAMPFDDTIPQNTEGDEYMTLAITPKSSSNKLLISAVINGCNGSGSNMGAALFQDSTAGSIACGFTTGGSGNVPFQIKILHYMDAGTTSATTFKVRMGAGSGTNTFNGVNTARIYGGVLASSITITEIKV